MDLNTFLIVTIMAAIAAPAFGADHIVGDDAGWKLGVNYTAWAQGKEFHVGDRLIFRYTGGSHNVFRLTTANGFQQCVAPKTTSSLTSGNDMITLASPGKKWYICGISDHCVKGMQLAINVISSADLAPSPAMPGSPDPNSPRASAAGGHSGLIAWAWVLTALPVYQMIMV